eukprot:CAMPEP_0170491108 /NCGR_PEP_ID=MMETSP0208-20121228/10405_1 /TAXON_ID=197538 /ORGANISM="Strombidium inclinatum, Strain S3" /LENGTH=184 /DNA_ID=CAMNT_0010766625 /DNA_START=41 /DNA_END=593 /DNA_ORIENTATION=+
MLSFIAADSGENGASAGQSHTVDAFTPGCVKDCEARLNYTEFELERQLDYFSRRLDIIHFENAMKIYQNLTENHGYKGKIAVHTYELYDKAFSFPRVRRYEFVQENMDMLEHFEDNFNLNISNKQNLANFIRVAQTVHKNFREKYHDGGFVDPADEDPYEEKEKDGPTTPCPTDPVEEPDSLFK